MSKSFSFCLVLMTGLTCTLMRASSKQYVPKKKIFPSLAPNIFSVTPHFLAAVLCDKLNKEIQTGNVCKHAKCVYRILFEYFKLNKGVIIKACKLYQAVIQRDLSDYCSLSPEGASARKLEEVIATRLEILQDLAVEKGSNVGSDTRKKICALVSFMIQDPQRRFDENFVKWLVTLAS